jgi:hypothetical protein
MRGMQCKVEFGYQLSIYCRTEENDRKPRSSWPVVQIIFKDSVRTAEKTPHFTVTKINCLTLFKEIIDVYCEKRVKFMNTHREQIAELFIIKQVVLIVTMGL